MKAHWLMAGVLGVAALGCGREVVRAERDPNASVRIVTPESETTDVGARSAAGSYLDELSSLDRRLRNLERAAAQQPYAVQQDIDSAARDIRQRMSQISSRVQGLDDLSGSARASVQQDIDRSLDDIQSDIDAAYSRLGGARAY